jgi:hypothetical protein
MFYKLADVIFTIPVGSPLWPFNMHEPLFIGIAVNILGYVSQAIANQAIAKSEHCLKMVLNI